MQFIFFRISLLLELESGFNATDVTLVMATGDRPRAKCPRTCAPVAAGGSRVLEAGKFVLRHRLGCKLEFDL
jgi:hypothetical protein